ncbi:energy-coupling factor transporter transmembrane component T family protein [Paracoccaceae bacterium GXU_MW_L88]
MISLTSPVEIWAHRLPAGAKLAALCAATLGLFFIQNLPLLALILLAILGLYASGGHLFLRSGLRQLLVLWPFLLIIAIWHLWTGAISEGAVILLRILSAVALANFVTMTTRLSDMMDVLHVLTRPLARFGLNPKALELAVALVIRMTPVLAEKGGRLNEAWRARSPRRAGWRIVLPFAVLALDDADHVAEALRARGGIEISKES